MKVFSVGKARPVVFALGSYLPAVTKAVEELDGMGFAKRLHEKDPTLWKGESEATANSLGWLDAPAAMQGQIEEITAFSDEIKGAGFASVVLLGMGGSSLAPEVMRRTYGPEPGYPTFTVLDSTDPAAIGRIAGSVDPAKTLFIVSSKSGTTIEPLSLFEYFFKLVSASKASAPQTPGDNFIAITDPGSPLEALATAGLR